MRFCRTCQTSKDLSFFHKKGRTRPGEYDTKCKACKAEASSSRYEALKARGVCPNHPKKIVAPGVAACEQCLKGHRDRAALAVQLGRCRNHPNRETGEYAWCAECRDKRSWNSRTKAHGVIKAQYDATYIDQRGLCRICNEWKSSTGKDSLVVDHCHKTKVFRGLLCHRCNKALGHANDDTALLKCMIKYLEASWLPLGD